MTPATGETQTSSLTISMLVAFLREHAAAYLPILARAGLNEKDLDDPDLEAPVSTLADLWYRAAVVQPSIGLFLIKRYRANQMHFVAHLAARSATLREALVQWARYARIVCETDVIELRVEGSEAMLVYENQAAHLDLHSLAEHYFSMTAHYASTLTRRPFSMLRVTFTHPEPSYTGEYARVFGACPVLFSQPENMLVFDASTLDSPLALHDDYLQRILTDRANLRLEAIEARDTLEGRIQRAIREQFRQGRPVDLESVATELSMNSRTIRGQLALQKTSFRSLLDDLRRAEADVYLRRGFSATQTCYLLGFSEPAAFQRACLRWFGCYAGEYRERHAPASPDIAS